MSNTDSLDDIIKRHESLYFEALQRDKDSTGKKAEIKSSIDKINQLIDDIKELSKTVNSLDDYQLLSDMAMKWQVVFSTIFDSPQNISLNVPQSIWIPPTSSVYTEKEIENCLKRFADFIYIGRRAESKDYQDNPELNWHLGEVFFASEVIDGRINYASRISFRSYWRLENIWLKEVKRLMAYYRWVKRKDISDSEKALDYFNACDHIRDLLINKKEIYYELTNLSFQYLQNEKIPEDVLNRLKTIEKRKFDKDTFEENLINIMDKIQFDSYGELILNYAKDESGIKAISSEFLPTNIYIENRYIDGEGKLLDDIKENHSLFELIKNKAYRIYETTESNDESQNWENAKLYVKMFYENIIPAVIDKNEENILKVLKAFQFSITNRFLIINCFEASIAIYFLDSNIIENLWKNTELETPTSSFDNQIEVESWPQSFKIDNYVECFTQFYHNQKNIGFRGVMTDRDKKALIDIIKNTKNIKNTEIYIDAVEKLYHKSRLINRNTSI